MERCAFVHRVAYSDFNPISPVRLNRWARESIVDDNSRFVDTVGRDDLLADCEVVVASHASVRRVFVWICVLACPSAPRLALWHGRSADPWRKSARVGQAELRFAVCVFL